MMPFSLLLCSPADLAHKLAEFPNLEELVLLLDVLELPYVCTAADLHIVQ